MRRALAPLVLALQLCAAVAAPNTPAAPQGAQTVALLAAIGDRIEVVRQRQSVGSRVEPYTRKTLQVNSQALNYAVLRGLDQALTEEEPSAQHVLLQWTMPEALANQVEKARGSARQDLVLGALTEHLKGLSARKDWDRIEVVIPAYTFLELRGMGTKLSGIGVYIQPLANQAIDISMMDATGDITMTQADGDYRTINPKTGETAHSSVYVAPYMYFERLTYDAKTLELIKRQRFFDNTKYADPTSTALDVSQQMTDAELMGKLVESVERSAYKSIRQTTTEVTASEPKPVAAPQPASTPAR